MSSQDPSCPSFDDLSRAFSEGDTIIQIHTDRCPACAAVLADLQRMKEAGHALPSFVPSEPRAEQLEQQLLAAAREHTTARPGFRTGVAVGALAASLLAFALSAATSRQGAKPPEPALARIEAAPNPVPVPVPPPAPVPVPVPIPSEAPDLKSPALAANTPLRRASPDAGVAPLHAPKVRTAPEPTRAPALDVIATRAPGSDADARFAAAFDRLRTDDPSAAAESFRALLASDPSGELAEDARYWLLVSLAKSNSADTDRVMQDFLSHHPDSMRSGEVSVMLGWRAFERGELDSAATHFTAAIDDPSARIQKSARRGLEAITEKRPAPKL